MWADDPTTMHSSSYNPTGTAVAVDGGYQVSGRWSFSSGCDHCRGVNLGAIVRGGETGSPTSARSSCCRTSTGSTTTGTSPASRAPAARTSSSTTSFVPEHRTQSHLDYALGTAAARPGAQRRPAVPAAVVGRVQHGARRVRARLGPGVRRHLDRARRRHRVRRRRSAAWPTTRSPSAGSPTRPGTSTPRSRCCAPTPRRCGRWPRPARPPTMADRARYRWNLNRGCERVGDAVVELIRAASGRSDLPRPPAAGPLPGRAGRARPRLPGPRPLAKAVGGNLLGTIGPSSCSDPPHRRPIPVRWPARC